ncbi:hypothetical protein [Reyranella sp.]|jgi:hypothetical protein|uniref:hypothetical protein n=1 Tax=Reyranella sp. TaxID=1929291 RepID=UPI002F955D23
MRTEDIAYPFLTSDAQALALGFAEGKKLRRTGALAAQLIDKRQIIEVSLPMRRGPGRPFYAAWRRGFDAGYLGRRKP